MKVILSTFILFTSFSLSNFLYSQSCCSPNNNSADCLSAQVKSDSFIGELTCQYSCNNDRAKKVESTDSYLYSTTKLDLFKGNGQIWAPLTMAIKYFSQENCLERGSSYCHNKGGIAEFKALKLDHPNGSINSLAFECQEEGIVSPFNSLQKSFQAFPELSPLKSIYESIPDKLTDNSEALKKRRIFNWLDNSASRDSKLSLRPSSLNTQGCSHELDFSFCYGDCLIENDQQMLATNKPLGTEKQTICMDDFLDNKIVSKINSSSIFQHYCETFIIEKLKLSKHIALSCSSSRIDVNCSELLPK